MNKIVTFTVSDHDMIQTKLLKIKKVLKNEKLSSKKLHDLEVQMCEISLKIKEQIETTSSLSEALFDKISSQQKALGDLIDQCHTRSVNAYVDQLTIKAQQLACVSLISNKDLSKKIKKIEESIQELHYEEGLSLENKSLIQVAKTFLKAASDHSDCPHMHESAKNIRLYLKKNETPVSFDVCDIALDLFDIANLLFSMNTKEAFSHFNRLPQSVQNHIETLLNKKQLSLDSLKNPSSLLHFRSQSIVMIQQLLAYSEELACGFFSEKTENEIEELFKDLSYQLEDQALAY